MSVAQEVGLTAQRELRRNLRSAKGIAMFALFVLGGLGGSFAYQQISHFLERQTLAKLGASFPDGKIPPELLTKLKTDTLSNLYPEQTAQYLADCPTVLLFLLKGTCLALPLLTLLVGFDLVAGETQHRTMRYMVGRGERASIVIGKALGVWMVVSLMVAVMHTTVWVLVALDPSEQASKVLSWGLRFWFFSIMYGIAYTGLTTLVSSLVRTPAVALFAGIGVIMTMGVTGLVLAAKGFDKALFAFPSAYQDWLVSHNPTNVIGAVGALFAWGAICLIVSTEIVRRKDV